MGFARDKHDQNEARGKYTQRGAVCVCVGGVHVQLVDVGGVDMGMEHFVRLSTPRSQGLKVSEVLRSSDLKTLRFDFLQSLLRQSGPRVVTSLDISYIM